MPLQRYCHQTQVSIAGPIGNDNPYLGLLAHGDRFVVTGDSISMLVEVARLAKPRIVLSGPSITKLRPC